MQVYHMRRKEKQIQTQDELKAILRRQKYLTLSVCRANEPYLFSVNYGYDSESSSFYFHCAKEGKKIDFLRENPLVFGQILEDNGYVDGDCDHRYKSIHFLGKAEFLEEVEEKTRAFELLFDQLETTPEPVKERFLRKPEAVDGVCIVRVRVVEMIGKANS